jgi:Fe-S-cluster-containing dehydrogenase component
MKEDEKSKSCEGNCSCKGGDFISKPTSRKGAIATLIGAAATGLASAKVASDLLSEEDERKLSDIEFDEYFKTNYRLMTDEERKETVNRLVGKAKIKRDVNVNISDKKASEGVLYGYAFNLSRCNGSRKCIEACCEENNQDRESNMQYIRMFEIDKGKNGPESGTAEYDHNLPPDGKYWMGTQCFQCENPPCVKVCPVGATWKEPDGITVIDYDWCVGCRYCEAACPYWARRFNWAEPKIEKEEINPNQHYLGNRLRSKGVMEKCTFCIQRTRDGKNPACMEACPTGARVFGNLLDPKSELRYILANKKVFRLKEDLGTDPKFWYFMD